MPIYINIMNPGSSSVKSLKCSHKNEAQCHITDETWFVTCAGRSTLDLVVITFISCPGEAETSNWVGFILSARSAQLLTSLESVVLFLFSN